MADPVNLQFQVKQNCEELQDFLKDLYKWEKDVQAKDQSLANTTSVSDSLPPVRNKSSQKKKPKPKPQKPSLVTTESKSKIKGSDFKAWDKYNVDEALRDIDEKEEMQTQSTSEEDEDTDDELAEQRMLQQALFEKEKGNDLFKEGKYEAAINRYTTAIGLDPYNAILPANRAMALIKVQRYGAAIQDCDTALELDDTYVKAYARRANAKHSLGRLRDAMDDYKHVVELQPANKLAMEGIEKIEKELAKKSKEATNTAKKDQVKDRSVEKPMKRYVIEEIGNASSDEEEVSGGKMTKEATSETTSEDKSALELGNSSAITSSEENSTISSQHAAENSHIKHPKPIKTMAENTEYRKTDDDRNPSDKPATEAMPLPDRSSNTSNSSTLNIDLPPPVSSIQFATTWKRLEKVPELLYKYLKGIPPDLLPKVLGESVESTLLFNILSIIREFYVRDNLPIFTELKYISEVKRFSMTLMFLSHKEKTVINDLFDYLSKFANDEQRCTQEELQNLRHKYGLR